MRPLAVDRKGQELGVQRQEKACRELCERMGWEVLKVYPENDVSASTTSKRRRPQYTEMLRDARDGLIDGIVVYSIDRLTRRISELTSSSPSVVANANPCSFCSSRAGMGHGQAEACREGLLDHKAYDEAHSSPIDEPEREPEKESEKEKQTSDAVPAAV
ncbi:recombinase family protein [Streptomyces sp. NPDC017230]|uniref:recombinase family protein n=1 Tax=unclassified Streptomyces TaxID=2593676 RepID=UPI0037905B03